MNPSILQPMNAMGQPLQQNIMMQNTMQPNGMMSFAQQPQQLFGQQQQQQHQLPVNQVNNLMNTQQYMPQPQQQQQHNLMGGPPTFQPPATQQPPGSYSSQAHNNSWQQQPPSFNPPQAPGGWQQQAPPQQGQAPIDILGLADQVSQALNQTTNTRQGPPPFNPASGPNTQVTSYSNGPNSSIPYRNQQAHPQGRQSSDPGRHRRSNTATLNELPVSVQFAIQVSNC